MMEIFITLGIDLIIFVLLLLASKLYSKLEIIKFDGLLTKDEKDYLRLVFIKYLISAAIQQGLLIGLFYLLSYIIPSEYLIFICSIIFCALHFPNIVLMFAVLGMQLYLYHFFSIVGLWYIPVMIFTHSFLASTLLKLFPESIHKNFLVGWDFYKYYSK